MSVKNAFKSRETVIGNRAKQALFSETTNLVYSVSFFFIENAWQTLAFKRLFALSRLILSGDSGISFKLMKIIQL